MTPGNVFLPSSTLLRVNSIFWKVIFPGNKDQREGVQELKGPVEFL